MTQHHQGSVCAISKHLPEGSARVCACSVTALHLQLYKADESLEFIHVAATFQFAVRALAFNPDGSRLAAAGDDASLAIVHVDIEDESSVPRTFNIGASTRSMAWDPEGTYLAIAQCNGTIRIWDMSSQTEIWSQQLARTVRTPSELLRLSRALKAGFVACMLDVLCAAFAEVFRLQYSMTAVNLQPSACSRANLLATPRSMQISVDSAAGLQLSWQPNGGKAVSMPCKDPVGSTVLAQRLRWGRTPLATLSDVHTDVATHSFFSPNGAPATCTPMMALRQCQCASVAHIGPTSCMQTCASAYSVITPIFDIARLRKGQPACRAVPGNRRARHAASCLGSGQLRACNGGQAPT